MIAAAQTKPAAPTFGIADRDLSSTPCSEVIKRPQVIAQRAAAEAAARNGEAKGLLITGFFADSCGSGVASVGYFRRAAEAGSLRGAYNYGYALINGNGVPKNEAAAFPWIKRAAEGNNMMALETIGDLYYWGTGVPENRREAVRWWRTAAGQGSTSAGYSLGVALRDGEGTERNYAEAFQWFKRGAEARHGDSMLNLAGAYFNGEGTARNDALAYEWYQRAAQRSSERMDNSAIARNFFGWVNEWGIGAPKNLELARIWYQEAANMGLEEAKTNLRKIGTGYLDEKRVGRITGGYSGGSSTRTQSCYSECVLVDNNGRCGQFIEKCR